MKSGRVLDVSHRETISECSDGNKESDAGKKSDLHRSVCAISIDAQSYSQSEYTLQT